MPSSVPLFTSFAVVGTGEVGLPIIQALAPITRTIVLSRNTSRLPPLPPGISAFQIDYEKQDSIVQVLKDHNVQVVISALNYTAMDAQKILADASKEANVQLFVPSEFGFASEGSFMDIARENSEFADYLKNINLPFTRYYIGMLYSWAGRLFGEDINGKFNIVGKGDVPVTYTDVRDVAGFVAYSTTHFPLAKLANKSFRLSGQTITPLDVARIYSRPVEYVESVPGPYGLFCTMIQGAITKGYGNVNWDFVKDRLLSEEEIGDGDARKAWPEHQWIQLKDVPLQIWN